LILFVVNLTLLVPAACMAFLLQVSIVRSAISVPVRRKRVLAGLLWAKLVALALLVLAIPALFLALVLLASFTLSDASAVLVGAVLTSPGPETGWQGGLVVTALAVWTTLSLLAFTCLEVRAERRIGEPALARRLLRSTLLTTILAWAGNLLFWHEVFLMA
jgi:hypothetical protein